MSGMAPYRARAAALPASLFALLALLCFPLVSQAQPPTYEDNVPRVGGEVKSQPDPKGKVSNAGAGGGTTSPGEGGSSSVDGSGSDRGSSDGKGGGIASGKGGDGDGTDQGSPGETGLGDQEKLAQADSQPGTIGNPTSSDSGSSPLVPILIAIAVLAAISIGVVLMRQRRHGDDDGDGSVPTEAG